MSAYLLRCTTLSLAQSGHPNALGRCPLSGVKQTSRKPPRMSAYDPKQTLAIQAIRSANLPWTTSANPFSPLQ
jgi:hypothetical protein